MRMLILMAGAAVLTIAAPLSAQGHSGHGGQGGHGGNGGQGGGQRDHARASRDGGGGHGQHGQGGGGRAQVHGQGDVHQAERGNGQGGDRGHLDRRGGQQRAAHAAGTHDQPGAHEAARLAHARGNGGAPEGRWAIAERGPLGRAIGHDERVGRPFEHRYANRVDWRRPGFSWSSVRVECPPGLAKKRNGCLPPGQARKWFAPGQRFVVAGYPWDRDVYGYYDWYGLRPYAVPVRYSSFYYDAPGYNYRYYGGNIYRVATGTDLVLGLIPLLGGGFAVGQPLPVGYNVYNVPYNYRTVYYDRPDVWYRYGDHAIYAVDPETRLVQDVVALVTGDVAVGQTLPVGYDTYNVPFAYRDRYYDNDDYLYRYSDGYIYRVEPRTRMVQTAILVS